MQRYKRSVQTNFGGGGLSAKMPLSDLMPLSAQIAGADPEGCIRWFPERAFDFGEDYSSSSDGRVGLGAAIDSVIIHQDPGHVGGVVWDAECILAHHIVEYAAAQPLSSLPRHASPPSLHGKKVIELGSGTGLSGIVAARLGASVVVLTELEDALPLLERNVHRNLTGSREGIDNGDGGGDETNVVVEELAWGAPLAGKAAGTLAPFDLILVADCVYVPGLYEDLKATITALGAPGSDVLVAFEQRRRDISPFFRQFDAPDAAPFEACASFSEEMGEQEAAPAAFPSGDALQPTPSQLGAAEAKKEETKYANIAPHQHQQRNRQRSAQCDHECNRAQDGKFRRSWVETPIAIQGRQLGRVHICHLVFE
jgi:predicted nicotinamide N-methyase